MRDCLSVYGDNTIKQKHMNKALLRKQGLLPVSITVPRDTVSKARLFLHKPDFYLPKEKKAYAWKTASV